VTQARTARNIALAHELDEDFVRSDAHGIWERGTQQQIDVTALEWVAKGRL
jgi:hypothetical protein